MTTFGDCSLHINAWPFHDGGRQPLPAEFPGRRQMGSKAILGHFGGIMGDRFHVQALTVSHRVESSSQPHQGSCGSELPKASQCGAGNLPRMWGPALGRSSGPAQHC